MIIREEIGLSYDDVLLVPQKGVLHARFEADLSTRLTAKKPLMIPIVSAPMSTVTEGDMARSMLSYGGYGFIHRFMTPEAQIRQYMLSGGGVALGLKEGVKIAQTLRAQGCDTFVLDIAHAHCNAVEDFMIDWWKMFLPQEVNLIIGNVATAEGARFLADLGADGVKVGIGPGAACTTRNVTGFGVPQLSAIIEVAEELDGQVPIIADGGIKNSGDIVKALAAGADTVMLGRLLAGCDEAPFPGEYFGMASKRVNGHNAPEGVEGIVERSGPVSDVLKSLTWGIRSGISYAGARNLKELRENAEFIRVTSMSNIETGVRI